MVLARRDANRPTLLPPTSEGRQVRTREWREANRERYKLFEKA